MLGRSTKIIVQTLLFKLLSRQISARRYFILKVRKDGG